MTRTSFTPQIRSRLLILSTVALTGCSAILGTRDLYLDDRASSDSDVTSTEGATSTKPGSDAGADAAPPETCHADLQSDPKNCGRCGRDCLGATCNAGMCAPITLANGLGNPGPVFLSGDDVYFGTYGDGRILSVSKKGGAPRELAKGQESPWGVLVDGQTLYWANEDYDYEAGKYSGGIWKCTLPACATPELVIAADHPRNPILVDGWLYVPEGNNSRVFRVKPDGTGLVTVASATQPFSVAADKTHAYYTSSQPQMWRAPVGGGAEEPVGPQAFFASGSVVVDAERVYWAYSEEAGTGHVLSVTKANVAAPRVEYGDATINKEPKGIAVDDAYVYWTNAGTRTAGLSNADGQVLACPKKGCAKEGPIVVAKELARPYGIAVDERAVYVSELSNVGQMTGTVRKVAKP